MSKPSGNPGGNQTDLRCPRCKKKLETRNGDLVCPNCGYREPAIKKWF